MGGKRQPAPPPVPSPREIAQTEVEFNRINQVTPFGNLTFSGPNRNTATLDLSPELQTNFNLQSQVDENALREALLRQGQVSDRPDLVTSINSNIPIPNPGDFDAAARDQSQAFFDRSSELLNRQFDQEEDALRDTLANQGLAAGGEAFDTEFGNFRDRQNQSFSRLANESVLAGEALRSQRLQEALQTRASDLNFQLQNAQLTQAARSQLQNELAQVLGQQQLAQPGLNSFFAPQSADVGGAFALRQNQLNNNFGIQSQAASNAKGGQASLLGTLATLGLS